MRVKMWLSMVCFYECRTVQKHNSFNDRPKLNKQNFNKLLIFPPNRDTFYMSNCRIIVGVINAK